MLVGVNLLERWNAVECCILVQVIFLWFILRVSEFIVEETPHIIGTLCFLVCHVVLHTGEKLHAPHDRPLIHTLN